MLRNGLLEFVQGRLNNYSIIFIVCVLTIHSALFASVTTQPPAGLCHVEHVHFVQCNLREDPKPDRTTKAQIRENYGKIPLYFIKNEGQMDKKVKYYEKGSGHAMFFTKEGVYLSLMDGQEREARNQKAEGKKLKAEGSGLKKGGVGSAGVHPLQVFDHEDRRYNALKLVKLIPIGANKNPEIVAEGLQECRVNYFVGNNPEKWKTGITTYSAVVYKDIYDGIDLKFYGNNRQLEYDVIVRPGADPSKVRFAYEGIEDLRVNDNGDLEIILNNFPVLKSNRGVSNCIKEQPPESSFIKGDLISVSLFSRGNLRNEGFALPLAKTQDRLNPSFTIIQKKPYVYQEINGKKFEIDGKFRVLSSEFRVQTRNQKSEIGNQKFIYGFQVASYDKHYPLIIDPKLVYSTNLGGSDWDYGYAIAVDTSGNVYVTGDTASTDFPTADAIFGGNAGSRDVFVTKLNASGSALVYSTYLGGSDYDLGSEIAVDTSGNVYVTGYTESTDFPMANAIYGSFTGVRDGFVTKINASGSALVYSTYLGGSSYDSGYGIAVDTLGNVYVSGETASTDFPTANAIYGGYAGGDFDVFLTKLNALGSVLVYSTYLGGSDWDYGYGIAVDTSGNVYVTGDTSSTDFPTADAIYGGNAGGRDVFVTKLNASGSALVYSTYLGGSGDDYGGDIAVDTSGNVYVAGDTSSTDFPTADAIYGGNAGSRDVFVTKLNASGSVLVYSTYLGGSDWDYGYAIAVDTSGNAYVTGDTSSTDFPTANAIYGGNAGGRDVFVTKISYDAPTAPSGSISINSGATYTNSTSVTLTLSAQDNSGVVGYYISTSSTTPSASASGWEDISSTTSYNGSISYTLSSGDGTKTVYVWYKDDAGNVSNTASDDIILDTTSPTITIISPTSDATYTTTSNTISLGGSASDSTSGINTVTWSSDKGGSGIASGTMIWDISNISLSSGENVITVTATDAAGNAGTDKITVTYSIPSPTPVSMVYGMVNDSYGDTLEGVTVTIVGVNGNSPSQQTETDEYGYYEFGGLAKGNYTLTYEKDGYETQTKEISLKEGEEKDLGTVTMPPKDSIYGYVVNVRDEPINKARVKLKGINTKFAETKYSDADGYFEFTGLEADTYLLFARKRGYLPKKLRIKLREGEEKDCGEIILRRKR